MSGDFYWVVLAAGMGPKSPLRWRREKLTVSVLLEKDEAIEVQRLLRRHLSFEEVAYVKDGTTRPT